MEIEPETIVDLVKGQGRIEQALVDLKDRLNIALPAIYNEHKELETRVRKVEGKQWYMSGLGSAAGVALGYIIHWFKR